MFPKAFLTLHSRMSGSRLVTTPLWSWRSFLYSSSLYSCQLFVISYSSVRSMPFLSFIVPIFAWNIPLVSLIFLKKPLVFPILLFSPISLHWSLKKAFLSLLAILWNSAFRWVYLSFSPLLFASLLFSAICQASSDNLFAFFNFFFLEMIFFFSFFFKFYFIFKLYKIVLVLPNIKMNPPQVYMCSPSWTLFPPPSP